MRLFYFKSDIGNFGDDLNPWLWNKVFPNFFDCYSRNYFVGIGSIIDERLIPLQKKIIFGSGVRGINKAPKIDNSWEIHAVRGNLSASCLDIPLKFAISDPAILVSNFYTHDIKQQYECSYMPYFRSALTERWQEICESTGLNYIDPRWDVDICLEEISKSKYIITEAMHGAIVADAFRIPWCPVQSLSYIREGDINIFKWNDWLSTLNMNVNFQRFPVLWSHNEHSKIKGVIKNYYKVKFITKRIKNIIKNEIFYISRESDLNNNINKFDNVIENFKNVYLYSK